MNRAIRRIEARMAVGRTILPAGRARAFAMAAAACAAAAAPTSAQAPPAIDQAFDAPAPDAIERGIALRKLGTTKSVLMIGAHPDDENTAVLAELSLGQGADVAYLSLTRGEGGQNGIGPEQQEALGLVRSEELLAARDMDRGRQYFTRAYDFGFSKSAEEAFRHWPREELLEDVVRVVRSFRPDVIVAVFTGTPSDGHGHHQASGILAREAFDAAADTVRFPRLGPPHAAAALYRARFRGTDDAAVTLATGALDPLLGRSHHQVAMAGRSQHRSQDMGQAQAMGPRQVGLDLVASRVEDAAGGLFAGVDTTLSMRAERAAGAEPRLGDALVRLRAYDAAVREPADLRAAAVQLDAALVEASRLANAGGGSAPADELLRAVLRERDQLMTALALDAGLRVDVRAEDATVVPGQTFTLTVSVWNGGLHPVEVQRVAPDLPAGWSATHEVARGEGADPAGRGVAEASGAGGGGRAGPASAVPGVAEVLPPGEVLERSFRVSVPPDAEPSLPYFLRAERQGDLYVWEGSDAGGRAFEPDPVRAVVTLVPRAPEDAAPGPAPAIIISRAAAYVDVDRTLGEYRLPVLVLPDVSVALAPGVALIPASDPRPVDFEVRVASFEPVQVAGAATLVLPEGWTSTPARAPMTIEPDGAGVATFRVVAPAGVAPGENDVAARFLADDGRAFEAGVEVIDYPHIRARLLPARALSVLQVLDVAVPADLAVGYVDVAGDGGPAALDQLGVDYTLLGPEDLASGDLDRFDTIVLGIRAYEFRPDVAAHNVRLLDYARRGGTLVVLYNRYDFARGEYAPYPLDMSRPHDRVTDETADVGILRPEHPLFTWPNAIGPSDFEGWVQERGLYFAGTWDERYEPLLEMADPGEAPLRGSILVAPLGDGTYVYTGLSLFRQLPAGVPGAYRLLANLIALGADREAS